MSYFRVSELELGIFTIISLYFLYADDTAYDPSSDAGGNATTRALLLQRLSNVAESGVWAFRVDGSTIESGGTYGYFSSGLVYLLFVVVV